MLVRRTNRPSDRTTCLQLSDLPSISHPGTDYLLLLLGEADQSDAIR